MPLEIFKDDWGMLHCNYHRCSFCSEGICYGGPYQCPNKVERARVCLPDAIEAYEDLKARPYGESSADLDDWYRDLAGLESSVKMYKSIINGESEVRCFIQLKG